MINIKNPHSVAKTLIKPCALKMLKNALGEEAVKKLKRIFLSDNVICSKIDDVL